MASRSLSFLLQREGQPPHNSRSSRSIHTDSSEATTADEFTRSILSREVVPATTEQPIVPPKRPACLCPGCGANFQSVAPDEPGFLPTSSDDKKSLKYKQKRKSQKSLSVAAFDDYVNQLDPETKKHFVYKEKETPMVYSAPTNSSKDEQYKDGLEVDRTVGIVGSEGEHGVNGTMDHKEALAKFTKGTRGAKNADNVPMTQEVCHRCFNLRYYDRSVALKQGPVVVAERDLLKFLKDRPPALVVCVVDLFDLPGSFLPDIRSIIGDKHGILLVANKLDLLPGEPGYGRISGWIHLQAKKQGITGLVGRGIHLISAKANRNVRELAEDIRDYRPLGGDVYLVGRTNVGKSELINALLRVSKGQNTDMKVTTSVVPGTTLGMLAIPFSRFQGVLTDTRKCNNSFGKAVFYDTPGITNKRHLLHLLDHEELKVVVTTQPFKAETYILHAGRSLMLGGVGRIDYVQGTRDHILVTVFSKIPPHLTSIEKADELYKRLRNGDRCNVITIPSGDEKRALEWPPMKVAAELEVQGLEWRTANIDIVFSGMGWVALCGQYQKAQVRVWSPEGLGVITRKPLMPYEYKGRVAATANAQRKKI